MNVLLPEMTIFVIFVLALLNYEVDGQNNNNVINLTEKSNFEKYENATFYGIRIHYPLDWEIKEKITDSGKSVRFISPLENSSDDHREKLIVSLDEEYKSFKNLTLYEYETYVIRDLRETLPNINITAINNDTVAGVPARSIEYSFFSGPSEFQILHLILIKNNIPYNVVYQSETEKYKIYYQVILKMIESLEMLDVQFLAYVNNDHEIRINYPIDWIKRENILGELIAVQFNSPPKNEFATSEAFLNIAVSDLDRNISLTEMSDFMIDYRVENLGYDISRKGITSLDGLPAYRILFLSQVPIIQIKMAGLEVWTIKENKLYVIGFGVTDPTQYQRYYPTAKKMIESFDILHE